MNTSLDDVLLAKKIEYMQEQVSKAKILEVMNVKGKSPKEDKITLIKISYFNDILLLLDMVSFKKYNEAFALFNSYSINKRATLLSMWYTSFNPKVGDELWNEFTSFMDKIKAVAV